MELKQTTPGKVNEIKIKLKEFYRVGCCVGREDYETDEMNLHFNSMELFEFRHGS